MPTYRQDNKADISPAIDRGEATSLMEPLLIGQGSRHRGALTDLAVEFAGKAAGFRRSTALSVQYSENIWRIHFPSNASLDNEKSDTHISLVEIIDDIAEFEQ